MKMHVVARQLIETHGPILEAMIAEARNRGASQAQLEGLLDDALERIRDGAALYMKTKFVDQVMVELERAFRQQLRKQH
jgi:hypothetical protein